MINTSSGFYGNVAKNAKFAYGLAPLPYYPDVPGAPLRGLLPHGERLASTRQRSAA